MLFIKVIYFVNNLSKNEIIFLEEGSGSVGRWLDW